MSYQDVMNTILPPQQGRSPHITGHYGEHRGNGPHGGSDFNYVGGQAGVNLTHPTLHSPVTGTVEFVGGRYGTVTIVDGEGNRHQLLHTQSQSVVVGQRVEPGTPIGTMGGRGPNGEAQYAQHVHYQMKDAQGNNINPETFWSQREHGGRSAAAAPAAAGADGVLRQGERGQDVRWPPTATSANAAARRWRASSARTACTKTASPDATRSRRSAKPRRVAKAATAR